MPESVVEMETVVSQSGRSRGEVPFDGAVDVVGTTAAQRVDELFVRLDDVSERLARCAAEDAGEREERHGEVVERAVERLVAGLLPDEAVQVEIGAGLFEVRVVPDRAGERLEPVVEPGERLGRHAAGGGQHGAFFEERAQFDPLADVLLRQPGDVRADVGRADDEAEPFELDERLADGGLADVELPGEMELAERVAGLKAAIEDGGAEGFEDAGADRRGLERPEGGRGSGAGGRIRESHR